MSNMHLIPFEVTLRTGRKATVRDVGPDDRHLLEIGFHHLSKKSRHFRFLSAHPRLAQAEITQFTASNSADHVAIGAVIQGDSEPIPLGIARYVRLASEGEVAESAVTIADDYQGMGLGSLLLGTLAKYAVYNGISEFSGLVLRENVPMLGLCKQIGNGAIQLDEPEVEVSIPLFADPAHYPGTTVGDLFRTAYALSRMETQCPTMSRP